MEIIDLGIDDLTPASSKNNDAALSQPTDNTLGPGIELLINDKKRSDSTSSTNIELGNLDSIENELNRLTDINVEPEPPQTQDSTKKTLSGMASDLFGIGGFASVENEQTKPIAQNLEDVNLGQATRESVGTTKTWDGFAKINEIPSGTPKTTLSERETRRKKRMMLKKMEEWQEKGQVRPGNMNYDMDSKFEEVEDEYETIIEEKRKKDSIKLQGWWFMTFVNSIEYANAAFNPFDINLDGWGEQISEDIDSYEEIFEELHEKYKGGKIAPELSLLLRLGFSAAVLNFSNKALSSATPGFNDIIKQSPELMKAFTDATVNTMAQQSPSINMAKTMMQDNVNKPRGPPPPAPVETKKQPPPQRPGNMVFTEAPGNRPDINAGRGNMFREEGIELSNTSPVNPQIRQEMKGPQSSDVNDILAGLKTKNIDIHNNAVTGNDSMVSIDSLKNLQNPNIPKKSNKKRNKSDKNTISLDI